MLTGFVYEIGLLKRYKRTGWLVTGVSDPEGIADHSFRAAALASIVAVLEGANPERAAPLFAEAIGRIHRRESISVLF